MDTQTMINIAAGVALSVTGWLARALWDAVHKLQAEIHQLEVDLPSNYIRKDEFAESMKEIKDMLNRIFEKLDKKADRP
jgi:predicted RNA-binding protein with EMAP domain